MGCLDKLASYLFYAMIVDFSLEALDFIHRIYESEESIGILSQLISGRLFISLIVIQVLLGMVLPLGAIVLVKILKVPAELRKLVYFLSALLVQLGIFTTRWNVVIGGQLFSKSFRGLTVYKMSLGGIEGPQEGRRVQYAAPEFFLLALPLLVLYGLSKLLPPWPETKSKSNS